MNSLVDELKEQTRKASEDAKSKEGKLSSLEKLENEHKKLIEDLEQAKKVEQSLHLELENAKKEASVSQDNTSASELEKYKSDSEDAAKVNAELRRELETVRIENGELKSSTPKKKHKDNGEKIKALEEKLTLATKKENELQSKIASLEDSKSTNSVDEVSTDYQCTGKVAANIVFIYRDQRGVV